MALDKSRLGGVSTDTALSADLFSVVPTAYSEALGDSLGDAAAQLEALLGRLDALDAQMRHRPPRTADATAAYAAQLAALRETMRQAADALRDMQATAPLVQAIDAQAQRTRAASEAALRQDMDELRQAGNQLLRQPVATARRQEVDREVSQGALRRAAQRLIIEQNATGLQAHLDAEKAAAAAGLNLSGGQLRAVRQQAHRVERTLADDPVLTPTKSKSLQQGYGEMLRAMGKDKSPGHQPLDTLDVEALIQLVLHQAYQASSDDLRSHALRLDYCTSLKNTLRDELAVARRFLSDNVEGSELKRPYGRKRFSTLAVVGPDGKMSVRPGQPDGDAKDVKQLEDYIKGLESQLATVGEDSQMAQLKLQAMVQRQQQTLQSLSNLTKSFHETHMSIIRKIGN